MCVLLESCPWIIRAPIVLNKPISLALLCVARLERWHDRWLQSFVKQTHTASSQKSCCLKWWRSARCAEKKRNHEGKNAHSPETQRGGGRLSSKWASQWPNMINEKQCQWHWHFSLSQFTQTRKIHTPIWRWGDDVRYFENNNNNNDNIEYRLHLSPRQRIILGQGHLSFPFVWVALHTHYRVLVLYQNRLILDKCTHDPSTYMKWKGRLELF